MSHGTNGKRYVPNREWTKLQNWNLSLLARGKPPFPTYETLKLELHDWCLAGFQHQMKSLERERLIGWEGRFTPVNLSLH
jgi:hypothetical protein